MAIIEGALKKKLRQRVFLAPTKKRLTARLASRAEFFAEEILAKLARTLGSFLLQNAMQKNHAIKFSSFDRMFPNQDFMPKGGFGNLIALPLQGNAVRQNKSVFVDDDFLPYHDQWNFLSHIEKCRISENDVKQFIKILGNTIVISSGTTAESETAVISSRRFASSEPSHKKSTYKKDFSTTFRSARNDSVTTTTTVTTTATDFASSVKITLSSCVLIQKSGNSEKALSVLRQLAVFSNPEFYKAQKMRLSTLNKPVTSIVLMKMTKISFYHVAF